MLNDFLKTIVGEETWKAVLPNLAKGTTIKQDPPQLKFFKRGQWGAQMPVEFSVAAYRFGHSMIRPIYRLNAHIPRFPIFSLKGESLVGFRDFPHNWAIDWRLFFNLEPAPNPNLGSTRIQPAYKIDSSLVNPLGDLPPSVASNPSSLPARNLLRGASMGLPSGQAVAEAMGFKPIPDEQLKVGKANEDDTPSNPTLASLSDGFKKNAPLWYYILAEAQQQFVNNDTPIHMGPVGGRIVAEVFAGMMLFDKHSFLNADPAFQPIKEFRGAGGQFGIAELFSSPSVVSTFFKNTG